MPRKIIKVTPSESIKGVNTPIIDAIFLIFGIACILFLLII